MQIIFAVRVMFHRMQTIKRQTAKHIRLIRLTQTTQPFGKGFAVPETIQDRLLLMPQTPKFNDFISIHHPR